jgi:hypothetical protein
MMCRHSVRGLWREMLFIFGSRVWSGLHLVVLYRHSVSGIVEVCVVNTGMPKVVRRARE